MTSTSSPLARAKGRPRMTPLSPCGIWWSTVEICLQYDNLTLACSTMTLGSWCGCVRTITFRMSTVVVAVAVAVAAAVELLLQMLLQSFHRRHELVWRTRRMI